MKKSTEMIIAFLILILIFAITIAVVLLLNMFGIIELDIGITNNTTDQIINEKSTPNDPSTAGQTETTDFGPEVTTAIDTSAIDSTETSNTTTEAPETAEVPSTQAPETTQESETTQPPDITTAPHTHSFSAWSQTKAPTCTAAGEKTRTCSCGEKETSSVVALGHTEVIDKAITATCTKTGLTEGKHCSVCRKVIVAQTTLPTVAHTYNDQYDATCNVCGAVREAECKHSRISISGGYSATCTKPGLTALQKCSDCGKILKEQSTIPATGHTEGTWYTYRNPTCTDDGELALPCKKCRIIINTTPIPALGHTEVIDTAIAPTCTATGLTEGKHCSVCNVVLVAQTTIPAKEHSYKNGICEVCGAQRMSTGLAYSVNSDGKTCTITGIGTCTDTKILIPSKIDGYTVNAIGDKAFAELTSLTAITLPDTVKTIGTRAFYKTGITEFTVPASVKDIGTQIFYGCDNLTTVHYNSSYYDSSNPILGVKSIEKIVFGCQYIPYLSYYGADKYVVTVEMTDSVKEIRSYAFKNCEKLTKVTIGGNVKTISSGAFNNCFNLTEVIISYGVTCIDSRAFNKCYGLTSISIPDSVTIIEDYAFCFCTSLTSITLPDSVWSIGEATFGWCDGLESIIIPNSVGVIDQSAFFATGNLKDIYYGGTEAEWKALAEYVSPDELKDTTIHYNYQN